MQLDTSSENEKNTLDALKQFWGWVVDRYEIEPLPKWPRLATPEMGFRKTVSIQEQESILAEVYRLTVANRIRSWIGCK